MSLRKAHQVGSLNPALVIGGEPKDKAEHFVRCPDCGGYFDLCDAGHVYDHLGPLPHPAAAQPQ